MKNMIIVIAMCTLIFCSHKIKEGEVVDKSYEPPQTWVAFMPMLISTGKTVSTIMIPTTHYDDEDFIVKVSGKDKDGNNVVEHFYINKQMYDTVNVGDWVCFSKDCMEYNDPIRQTRKE